MAAIDKIYGTKYQWKQLYDFLVQLKPEYIDKYIYKHKIEEIPDDSEIAIANFSRDADLWLMQNCNLDFVQKRLQEQYSDYERPIKFTTELIKEYMKAHDTLLKNLADS